MVEMPECGPDGPRNIVLLSDGTGNSSASVWRTNVWRMYESLDLSSGSQLALYDNGVGTSTFRPLAVLGGALGWGLKRNVRDLYTFVCRNYRPKDGTRLHDDRIFAMGFSRGAFTIRVLVDLIGHQGLITDATGRELDRKAKWAYREYRRQFKSRLHVVSVFRWLRDMWLKLVERRKAPYDRSQNRDVRVEFMGLWDTVDAYGLPMDEMTRGWDQWVWPLKMDSHKPPGHVNKICHAVALDDERHTFHPVLIDEDGLEEKTHIDQESVTQVWFAGVHSNVGGSYPDDSLAHVPMQWMADEARKHGLRLHKVYTDVWLARSDPHGPIYDSRRGLGSYYRYNPRNMARLTADDFAHVSIPRPKIHCSVFQRIAAGRDEYAPLVLPARYAVVGEDGGIVDFDTRFESKAQAQARALTQERVWDRVWIRRVLYFATVIATLLVALPPLVMDATSGRILPLPWKPNALVGLVDVLDDVVPPTFEPVLEYYRDEPLQLFVPAALIAILMIASSRVQRATADRMREIWSGRSTAAPHGWIYGLRTHAAYRRTFQIATQHVFPFVFGMLALAAAVLIVGGTVNRGVFAVASAAGSICEPEDASGDDIEPRRLEINASSALTFSNKNPCTYTEVLLENGGRYRASFEILGKKNGDTYAHPGTWYDGGQAVASAEGFSSGDNIFVAPFLPFRRILTMRWFVPVLRIGEYTAEYHALTVKPLEFTPRTTGPLFVFVNDAIGPMPWWTYFYDNNDESIGQVTITRLPDEAVEGSGRAAQGQNAAR